MMMITGMVVMAVVMVVRVGVVVVSHHFSAPVISSLYTWTKNCRYIKQNTAINGEFMYL
jgi:hypothetical protein